MKVSFSAPVTRQLWRVYAHNLPMEDGEVALLLPWGGLTTKPGFASSGCHRFSLVRTVADKRHFRHFMKEIHEQPDTADLWVARHLPQGLPLRLRCPSFR